MGDLPTLDDFEQIITDYRQRDDNDPGISYCVTLKRAEGTKDRVFCATHAGAIENAIDHARLGTWKPTGISTYKGGKFRNVVNGNHDLDRLIADRLAGEELAERTKAAVAQMEELPGFGSF